VILVRAGAGAHEDEQRASRVGAARQVLAGMPLFARLGERELLRIMQVSEPRSFGAHDVIVREGDAGEELFVCSRAGVRVKGGAVLRKLRKGEHFGEWHSSEARRDRPRVERWPERGHRHPSHRFLRYSPQRARDRVKILWQFLGALADRLDQTSSDLRDARRAMIGGDFPGLGESTTMTTGGRRRAHRLLTRAGGRTRGNSLTLRPQAASVLHEDMCANAIEKFRRGIGLSSH